MRRSTIVTMIAGLACCLTAGCSSPGPIQIMSLNVSDAASAGAEDWADCRADIVGAVQTQSPDVVALQGVYAEQVDELVDALDGYAVIAAGAADGRRQGEHVPIFYRRKRFTLLDAGHFWLSSTPRHAGSIGWDAREPRIATWVRLRFKDAPFVDAQIVNVRFDDRGERAQLESAKLLRKLADAHSGQPLVVVGEFNCRRGSAPFRVLMEDRKNLAELRDAAACGVAAGDSKRAYPDVGCLSGSGQFNCVLFNRRFAPLAVNGTTGAGSADGAPTVTLRLCATGYA